ncbi:MAG: rhodanese-like domain protein [Gammaproteobacteria bacterium]|nr:rhodanese-like domain protein [Gammaproteobacteria bacterium]
MAFTTLIDVPSLHELRHAAAADPAGSPAARGPVLLDCRFDLGAPDAGRQAYWAAHIPGAHYADLNRDLAGPVTADSGRHPLPSPTALLSFFASLGIGRDTQVVAYDDANGAMAARAWWLLRWLGHDRVAVLDGGFNAWLASGGHVEAGAAQTGIAGEAARLAAEPRLGAVMDTTGVLHTMEDPARLLVDARAPERFAGTVEPIDPIAGHVPGAVNHPFTSNLGPEGRFLAAEELRRRWLHRLGATDPANVILMCGSGVTACHNLLAMEVAGLPGALLYAGSWSEWIRDPKRPVARGIEP